MSNAFWEMGGYARYLWPAYALTFFVIGYNIWSALRAERSARAAALRRMDIQKKTEKQA